MNPSTALATVLVDELIRGGVREAVLSPGSRSAPLAFALHGADATGRIRLHVRVDERSAGFLALGLAKASAAPVLVTCTSGTAAANLHPAVVEASHADVPLVVLTADRPPELRGVGANQTIEQAGLYGGAVRWAHDLGVAEARAGQVAGWRSLVCRALAAAAGTTSRDPGPVHLNVPFREPLVPGAGDAAWVEPLDGRAGGGPWTRAQPGDGALGVPDDLPARTLVVVGDCPPALAGDALRLAEARGWPVLSEPSGNARRGPNAVASGDLLLGNFLAGHRPERVLVVGRTTLSRPLQRLLAASDLDVVASGWRWTDVAGTARRVLPRVPATTGSVAPDPAWLPAWQAADELACRARDGLLEAAVTAVDGRLNGPLVAREVAAALPANGLLVAGSSNPVRDLFLAAPTHAARVLANRGVAGIDGTVSTAIGAALAHQRGGGGAAFALLGDLTFLHDGNGLVIGPEEPRPDLTIVVVNDDGGGIFGLLEPGAPEHATSFERVFGTPHGTDLAALAAAHHVSYESVTDLAGLRVALRRPASGLRVVEVPVDRGAHRGLHARLRRTVDQVLSGQPQADRDRRSGPWV